jgi:hypothetical protein
MPATASAMALTADARDDSLCGIISDALPSICTCKDSKVGGNLTCEVDLLVDKFTFIGDIQPCAMPAYMSFDVLEDALNFDCCDSQIPGASDACCLKIEADGPPISNPIPGISIVTPLGSGGAYVDLSIEGNAAALKFKVAMDVCVSVPIVGKKCGSSIDPTGTLPVQILDGTFDFSDICH